MTHTIKLVLSWAQEAAKVRQELTQAKNALAGLEARLEFDASKTQTSDTARRFAAKEALATDSEYQMLQDRIAVLQRELSNAEATESAHRLQARHEYAMLMKAHADTPAADTDYDFAADDIAFDAAREARFK